MGPSTRYTKHLFGIRISGAQGYFGWEYGAVKDQYFGFSGSSGTPKVSETGNVLVFKAYGFVKDFAILPESRNPCG